MGSSKLEKTMPLAPKLTACSNLSWTRLMAV